MPGKQKNFCKARQLSLMPNNSFFTYSFKMESSAG
jgi:hypothetical protein